MRSCLSLLENAALVADVRAAPVVFTLVVFEPVPASGEQFPDGVPPAVDAVLPVVARERGLGRQNAALNMILASPCARRGTRATGKRLRALLSLQCASCPPCLREHAQVSG